MDWDDAGSRYAGRFRGPRRSDFTARSRRPPLQKYSVIVARDASAGDRIVGVVDVRQRSAQPWIAASLDRRFGPEACSSGSYFEISNLAVLPQYR